MLSPPSPPSRRQTKCFSCVARVWGHQDTEVGAVLPRVTLHKLSWEKSLCTCCEYSSRGKHGPASYALWPSLHCLLHPLCSPNPLAICLTSKDNVGGGRSKLTSGAVGTDAVARGGRWGVAALRCPRFLRRYCSLWHIHLVAGFPTSESHARKWARNGKAKGKKNIYIFSWGPGWRNKDLGWPWCKKYTPLFHPFTLCFPLWVLLPSLLTLPQLAL